MILEKFGWSWQYLLWGIRYPIVQKMMADAPWTDFKTDDDNKKAKKGKTSSLRDFLNSQVR